MQIKDISYIKGGLDLVDRVGPMWEKLRKHHLDRTTHFKGRYDSFTFEDRKLHFKKNEKEMLIVIVTDTSKAIDIGYVISSVSNENVGEIESLYLDYDYRGLKIGDVLMNYSLEWIKEKDVKRITIGVAAGNEDVFPFYEKFGFYPKVTMLERP